MPSNHNLRQLEKVAGTAVKCSPSFNQRFLKLIICGSIFEELKEHWQKVVECSDLTEKQLKEELKYYKTRIKLSYVSEIPTSTLLKAHALVDDIDEDDTFFIALHLHTGHKIWSGDEKLKKGLTAKGYGHFFTSTEELKKHLYKKEEI